jgi:hypothetical protein
MPAPQFVAPFARVSRLSERRKKEVACSVLLITAEKERRRIKQRGTIILTEESHDDRVIIGKVVLTVEIIVTQSLGSAWLGSLPLTVRYKAKTLTIYSTSNNSRISKFFISTDEGLFTMTK